MKLHHQIHFVAHFQERHSRCRRLSAHLRCRTARRRRSSPSVKSHRLAPVQFPPRPGRHRRTRRSRRLLRLRPAGLCIVNLRFVNTAGDF